MEPSDEELLGLMPQQMHEDLAAVVRAMAEQEGISSTPAKGVMRIILNRHVVDLARAVLARYGHQPAPPTEGEVADLIAWLGDEADQYDCIQQAPETARRLRRAADLFAQRQPAPPAEGEVAELVAALRSQAIDCTCDHLTSGDLRRAADLLQQRHPTPVPVSERLPGPGDCDGEGRCWWEFAGSDDYGPSWTLMKMHGIPSDMTRWLPAWVHALPLPAVEVKP